MSTADFVFIESKDPIFLDLQAFCTALREKFPGILIRERTNPEKAYSLSWDYQSPQLTLESSLSSKKNVFVIDYFDSTNRLQDYASYIIWLRKWFHLKRKFPFVMKVMSMCLNFLVIYPKRSWKTTYEQGLMSEEEVQKRIMIWKS